MLHWWWCIKLWLVCGKMSLECVRGRNIHRFLLNWWRSIELWFRLSNLGLKYIYARFSYRLLRFPQVPPPFILLMCQQLIFLINVFFGLFFFLNFLIRLLLRLPEFFIFFLKFVYLLLQLLDSGVLLQFFFFGTFEEFVCLCLVS